MDNQQKNEILTAIGYGKCVSHKLPSYMQDKEDKTEYNQKSVAEQVLFR